MSGKAIVVLILALLAGLAGILLILGVPLGSVSGAALGGLAILLLAIAVVLLAF